LSLERAVFPVFSSREVNLGQMRKIGIHLLSTRWSSPTFSLDARNATFFKSQNST